MSRRPGRAWATAGFLLGIGVSVGGNVAHARHPSPEILKATGTTAETWQPELGAQLFAAFWPIALLVTIEVLARVDWPRTAGWALARYGGAAVVAGVAAVMSYVHLYGLLKSYGEGDLTAQIGPLSVDGLMVVCGFALLARGSTRLTDSDAPARDESRDGTGDPDGPRDAHPAEHAGDDEALTRWPLPVLPVPLADQGEPLDAAATVGQGGPDGTEQPPAEAEVRPDAGVPEGEPDVPEHLREAVEAFAAELERGRVPGIRPIKKRLGVGQDRAREVQAELAVLADR